MNRKRLQQVILGSAGAVVLAGVALLAAAEYQAGHQFAPMESDRALNVNQVVFPEQEKQSETSDRSQDDNCEMWEKDRNADENEHPRENGNADYLIESRQTLSSNANQTAAVAGDTPNSATAGAGAARPRHPGPLRRGLLPLGRRLGPRHCDPDRQGRPRLGGSLF